MSEQIDWPVRKQPSRSGRFAVILLIVVILAILFSGRTAVSYWVDLLWYRSLGYSDVFLKTLSLQWSIFSIFLLSTFLFLFGAFALLRHAHRADLPRDHTLFIGGRSVTLSVNPVLNFVAGGGSLLVALVTGGAMAAEWPTLALYWYAAPATDKSLDPIFSRPIDFYLFTLPAWHLIAGWLLTLALLGCGLAVLFMLVTGGTRALGAKHGIYDPLPWRSLSFAISFLLLTVALQVYLGRFDLLPRAPYHLRRRNLR